MEAIPEKNAKQNNTAMIIVAVVFLITIFGSLLCGPIISAFFENSERREAVENYFQEMAQYACKIESIKFEGNKFYGRISLQNGFGAWTTADFYGSAYKIGNKWDISGHVPEIEDRDSKIREASEAAIEKLKEVERALRGY